MEMTNDDLLRQTWTYEYPEPFEWQIPGYSVSLRSGLNQTHDWETLRAVEYGYFTIKADSTKLLTAWVQDVVDPLHEMLKFGIFAPVRITRIRPLFADEAANAELGTLDSYSSDLIVNRPQTELEDTRSARSTDMLFKAEHITNDILANLMDPNSQMNQIRTRFLTYEQSPLTRDDFFLAYVRQLESLHRVLFPVPAEEQKFAERLDGITQRLSDKDGELVSGRMTYAYEPSLSARLHRLAKPWKPTLASVVGSKALLGAEIDNVGDHRNFLAHELPESRRVFSGRRLRRVTLFLMVLARLVALQQAGFDVSLAENVVTDTELYNEFRTQYAVRS